MGPGVSTCWWLSGVCRVGGAGLWTAVQEDVFEVKPGQSMTTLTRDGILRNLERPRYKSARRTAGRRPANERKREPIERQRYDMEWLWRGCPT